MANQNIENKLKLLPDCPGCYLMKDLNGKVIYVGKSKNLKNRVRSYFKSKQVGRRAELVRDINDFEIIVVSSDKEAFLLEITLIKKYQPYYNVQLKNGGGYPFIEITNERDPEVKLTSIIKKDKGYYFGPYPNVYAAQATLKFIQKMWPLRRCSGKLGRPCLYYSMGQCLGSCFKEVSSDRYDHQIKQIKCFLNGDITKAKTELIKKMQIASDNLEFERASEYRDQLSYIEQTVEKQKIMLNDKLQRDIFNFYVSQGWISIQILFIRQSKLMRRETKIFNLTDIDKAKDEFESFIVQFYNAKNRLFPNEILVPKGVNASSLAAVLKVRVKIPSRGQKKALLDMAYENSKIKLDEKNKIVRVE